MKSILATTLFAGFLALAGVSPATATTIHFDVTTSPLVGAPNGPFYLDFVLNGTAGNNVTVTDFSFGGGSAGPTGPNYFGNASGSLASSVNLSDGTASFFNEFFQEFTPGATLSFNVLFNTGLNSASPSPDAFSFYILDSSFAFLPPISTTEPTGANALAYVPITSALRFSDVATYRSTSPAGVVVTATPVPEPASLVLIAVGLVGFGARRLRRARQ